MFSFSLIYYFVLSKVDLAIANGHFIAYDMH